MLRATPEDEPTVSELLASVDAALAGVDLDYHDPFYEDIDDGIQAVEEAVEEVEQHLDGGAHPVVRRVLQQLAHPAGRSGTGRRLRDAGQPADALTWLDGAVTQGCVDVAWRAGPTIVPVEDAVDACLDGGRPDAALAISRTLLDRDLSVDVFRLVSHVAERCGRQDEQRTWAFEQATQRARSSGGAHLVRLHLADGNVAQAWEAADAFVAGHAWRELVDASEDDFPLRAGHLCLAQVLESLTTPDSKRYPALVDLLVRARALYDAAGHRVEADAEIIRVRDVYRRRPALMSAVNRAGLPS